MIKLPPILVILISLFCEAVLLLTLLLSGCGTPSWTNASPEQRAAGAFRPDGAFLASQQFSNSIVESVDTVEKVKEERK